MRSPSRCSNCSKTAFASRPRSFGPACSANSRSDSAVGWSTTAILRPRRPRPGSRPDDRADGNTRCDDHGSSWSNDLVGARARAEPGRRRGVYELLGIHLDLPGEGRVERQVVVTRQGVDHQGVGRHVRAGDPHRRRQAARTSTAPPSALAAIEFDACRADRRDASAANSVSEPPRAAAGEVTSTRRRSVPRTSLR